MESIQAVREAIENLSTDEKIDEGQYLALMNHLKLVYEKIGKNERNEPSEPENNFISWRENQRRQREEANELSDRLGSLMRELFNTFEIRTNYFGAMAPTILKYIPIFDGILVSLKNEDNSFGENHLLVVDEMRVGSITDLGMKIWIDLNAREIFLSNPLVRKKNISYSLLCRDRDEFLGGKRFDYQTEEGWTRILSGLSLPFYTSKRIIRRNHRESFVERDAMSLGKYHPITLTMRFHHHPNVIVNLYTDKVQLGRSNIAPNIYMIMMMIIRMERWVDEPLERLIYGRNNRRPFSSYMEDTYFPKLKVSGITAHTREKQRTYEDSRPESRFTIAYTTKYSNSKEEQKE